MADKVNLGDIVFSTHGRDKGYYFLVVGVSQTKAYIADGKIRKLSSVKSKNQKHLKSVKIAVLEEIAIKIQNGQPVSNQKLFKAIKSQIKKQED